MRICQLIPSEEPSGVGEHVLALGRELRAHHDVVIAAPPSATGAPLLQRAAGAGLRTVGLDPGATVAHRPLGAWLAEEGFDVVHVHAGVVTDALGATQAAGTAGRVVVRTEHQPDQLTRAAPRRAHAAAIEACDRVIAVSDEVGATLRLGGVPASKLRVVRNGVHRPVPQRDRHEVRAELGVPADAPLVLTVGRLRAQKGYHHLVDAVPDVLGRVPGAVFAWVGEGLLERSLRARAGEVGVAAQIRFLGRRPDVPDLVAAADAFVLPSLWEGLPLVLLEAMALAVPVLATDVCGSREVVVHGETGLVVPPAEPRALAAATAELLTDRTLAARLGAAGQARWAEVFSAGRMADEVLEVYEEARRAAAGRPSSRPDVRPASRRRGGGEPPCRVGVIGAGYIGGRHARSLAALEGVRVAAVADPDEGRAGALAAACGARAHVRWEDLLEAEDLDAVYVCVPPFAHGDPERAVLARELPLFVEKPLALDLGTAEDIAARVAAAGVPTAVGYHWRHLDTTRRARTLVEAYGPARLAMGYWLDAAPPVGWWVRRDGSGGQVIEQATHVLDLARFLLGEVASVSAVDGHRDHQRLRGGDVPGSSVVTLVFESGAIGTIAATAVLGWTHRTGLHVVCDDLVVELGETELVASLPDRLTHRATTDALEAEDREFIDVVRGRRPAATVPYAEALRTHRLAVAADQAARTGEVVRVPADAAHPRQ